MDGEWTHRDMNRKEYRSKVELQRRALSNRSHLTGIDNATAVVHGLQL